MILSYVDRTIIQQGWMGRASQLHTDVEEEVWHRAFEQEEEDRSLRQGKGGDSSSLCPAV